MRGKPQDKGKRQGKGKRLPRGQGKSKPGILLSWEDFTESAMREYLAAVTDELVEVLDAQEQAFRGGN